MNFSHQNFRFAVSQSWVCRTNGAPAGLNPSMASTSERCISYNFMATDERLLAERHSRPVAVHQKQFGFSLIELMMVLLVLSILIAVAAPSVGNMTRTYRLTGDARAITAQLNLARMRAASLGTKTRLNVNLNANTYQIEGDSFGFGAVANPAGQQSQIAQGYPGETGCGCVYFNSRGLVTDSAGNATANAGLYLSNGNAYTAVTLTIAGQTTPFIRSGTGWNRL
jgi:prepilin-type N-terminal cleavage/methylation domain-containing protein